MKRVIGPYVFEGGGAKSLNYQSLARDLGRATLEIPFNIPPYFALIARALGILEGSFPVVCRTRRVSLLKGYVPAGVFQGAGYERSEHIKTKTSTNVRVVD